MTQSEKFGDKPQFYDLSGAESPILVTAQATNEPLSQDEDILLGNTKTEKTRIEASVMLHPPGGIHVCTGMVSYPYPLGREPDLTFQRALQDLGDKYSVQEVYSHTIMISAKGSLDDVKFIQHVSNPALASQSSDADNDRNRIYIFSNRKNSDDQDKIPYAEQEIDIDDVVMDVGRIVAQIANSIHAFYGSDQPARLDINLPDLP